MFTSDLCPAGTYLPDDEEFCLSCGRNTFSTEGASSCTPCETGAVANAEKTLCGTFLFLGIVKSNLDNMKMGHYTELNGNYRISYLGVGGSVSII
jgi:hypothetical protein